MKPTSIVREPMRPRSRRALATIVVVVIGLGLAACESGSNQVDEERVERLLAEPVMAKRPDGATVVQEPIGLVSERENPQYLDGGPNGALLQLQFPDDASLEVIGRNLARSIEDDGWQTITIQCIESSPTDNVRIGGRKWLDDFEASLSIEINEPLKPGDGTDVSVSLRAPFHTSNGDRPGDAELVNDCDWK